MSKKFGALAEFRQAQVNLSDQTNEKQTPEVNQTSAPEQVKGRGRPAGKRSNPDYEPTTVLLRKQTKKRASRLLEDTDSEHDLSELIESLLLDWISIHS